jgi:hypothetical protein
MCKFLKQRFSQWRRRIFSVLRFITGSFASSLEVLGSCCGLLGLIFAGSGVSWLCRFRSLLLCLRWHSTLLTFVDIPGDLQLRCDFHCRLEQVIFEEETNSTSLALDRDSHVRLDVQCFWEGLRTSQGSSTGFFGRFIPVISIIHSPPPPFFFSCQPTQAQVLQY